MAELEIEMTPESLAKVVTLSVFVSKLPDVEALLRLDWPVTVNVPAVLSDPAVSDVPMVADLVTLREPANVLEAVGLPIEA